MSLRTALAFVRRDFRRAISYRLNYVLELASMLFALALFFYIGELVGASSATELGGAYFPFAAIGVAFLRILQSGVVSFANRLREEQMTGTLEALMVCPASTSLIILSTGAYDLLRGAVSSLVMLGLAVAMFDLALEASLGSALVGLLAFLACIVLFAALGVLIAAFTVVFKQTTAVLGLAAAALALLAGAYFPVEVMPGALEAVAKVLPFTWALDVLRSALLERQIEWGLLGLLLVASAAAVPVSLIVFGRALHHTRRTGTLAHY